MTRERRGWRWTGPVAALALAAGVGVGVLPGTAVAAVTVPAVSIGVGAAHGPAQVAASVQILLALTVLSLAPAILLLMTSFTRIVVVLSFARSALATGTLPPNQILVGLALFLTLFVMAPTFHQIYTRAWQPYQAGRLKLPAALQQAEAPLRAFMLRQTSPTDLRMFQQLQRRETSASGTPAGGGAPAHPVAARSLTTASAASGTAVTAGAHAPVPLTELVPAFVVGELRIAFEMGFVLYVPFVIIDLVVSSTLMAMGMLMLPPTLISTPFKVLLFVLVNGWTLLAQSLVLSFH